MTILRWTAANALIAGALVVVWLFLPSCSIVAIPDGVSSANSGMAERGAYIVRAGGCVSCHSDKSGQAFAGGRALKTPFGTFYSPNITPDKESGIGDWSDEDFARAVTLGETPHGQHLYPVFPYTSYSRMTVEDALAIKAHLATLPAVHTERLEHDLSFPYSWRQLMKGWKLLFFAGAEPLQNEPSRDATWNRGRYLVDALGHCGECHTPRGMLGQADNDRYLRGNAQGPDGWKVPAVAGDTAKIHAWSVDEIAEYLKTGTKPDFDNAQGPMAEVIEDSTSHLTDEDRHAVAYYLQSLGRKEP